MASKNAKDRRSIRALGVGSPPSTDDDDALLWFEDWGRVCTVCGQTPCLYACVSGVQVVPPTRCADCLEGTGAARTAIKSGY